MKTRELIRHFGGQSKLARALGIKTQAITQWKEYPPLLRQYQIERITGGLFKVNQL